MGNKINLWWANGNIGDHLNYSSLRPPTRHGAHHRRYCVRACVRPVKSLIFNFNYCSQ